MHQAKCNNIIIFEHDHEHTGFVNLLENELSEQKVDNTGCPYDSSGLWGMFLLCCVSLLLSIRSTTSLVISVICSLTVYKACHNYQWSLTCVMFLYAIKLNGKIQNMPTVIISCKLKRNWADLGFFKCWKMWFWEQTNSRAKKENNLLRKASIYLS